ncbi:unnamed protein product, partial [Allacma fusca]
MFHGAVLEAIQQRVCHAAFELSPI